MYKQRERKRETDKSRKSTGLGKQAMQGTSLLGKHVGRNVSIFMRGSCAGGWPNNMDIKPDAGWDSEAKHTVQ